MSNIKLVLKIFFLFLFCCSNKTFYVKRVIDGDTFVVSGNLHVRLLSIDAPERGDPFWENSKRDLEKMILNKKVRLEYDIRKYDKYNRILAYVFVNKEFVNQKLIEEGLAWVYVIPPNFKYSYKLMRVQEKAKELKKGIWGKPYYIASRRGRKFHIFHCPSAKRISRSNRIIFKSREEALKRGYKPAKDCNP